MTNTETTPNPQSGPQSEARTASTDRNAPMTGRPRLETLRALAQRRDAWLAVLLIVALCWFASYVRYSIGFKDEGGTVALIAKRMLAGERPFIDIVPGYNVMWFYPVVGLFKLFGVNFVLLRGYCFFLSTIT